jgi:hypothetical protein
MGEETTCKTEALMGNNINMHLQKMERGGMNWIELAQDRDRWRAPMNAEMYLQVP